MVRGKRKQTRSMYTDRVIYMAHGHVKYITRVLLYLNEFEAMIQETVAPQGTGTIADAAGYSNIT